MGMFDTVNTLVVTRNLWVILLHKIRLLLNLVKPKYFFLKLKGFQICPNFYSNFSGY
jgi:hypothetical protein